VANFFIYLANETGSFVSNLKLQKLVYYAQAWYLALYDDSLFPEDFQAWVHGPVIPALYAKYKSYQWRPISEEVEKPVFNQNVEEFLNEVAEAYFSSDAYELERMTHIEDPWLQARGCLPMDAACNTTISKKSMKEYYRSRVQE